MSEVRITDPETGGQKGQKPERFDLIPMESLEEVARVYGFGATKYADDNWRKGYSWRLSIGALLRHVARFMLREDIDSESGCHHLAHAAWHCLTLLAFAKNGLGRDDRAGAKPMPASVADLAAKLLPERIEIEVGDQVRVRPSLIEGAYVERYRLVGRVGLVTGRTKLLEAGGGFLVEFGEGYGSHALESGELDRVTAVAP